MSQTIEVFCDNCGTDLTYTGNCEDYRLVLGSQPKAPWYVKEGRSGGAVTAMAIPDPMPLPRHFCKRACLKDWLAEERPKPKLEPDGGQTFG